MIHIGGKAYEALVPGGHMCINIADVMAIVNHILGNEVQTFVFENADLNADQTINVSDVMRVVNIILNLNPEAEE